jgi:aldose 1-epimerase
MTQSEFKIESILLVNQNGMSVEVINLGARVKSIRFPVNGTPKEMTVSYSTAEEYLNDNYYLGATCGRVCNRIANGEFELDGQNYQLTKNEANNCLHGGIDNFSFRLWTIDTTSVTGSSVTLLLTSQEGDQGFPGSLIISVTYQLTHDNKLLIQYFANTDKPTPINLTNHCYFSLGSNSCEDLFLKIQASSFLELNDTNLPTGNLLNVKGNEFDFNSHVNLGERQQQTQESILIKMKGYDHCFVLDNTLLMEPKAELISLDNNVCMTVYTDQPAIQLYTGAYLSGGFKPYQGVCLEAQNYPDAVNFKHFPNSILKANETYQKTIVYGFEYYDDKTQSRLN